MTATKISLTTHPLLRKSALAFIAALVLISVGLSFFAFTRSAGRDLSVADAAIDFETAVYGRNYEGMWDLSAGEYRRGMTRDQFIAWARENTPEPTVIYDWTALNEKAGDVARVHTHFQLKSGELITNELMLNLIDGEWRVVSYEPYEGPWPPEEPPLAD